MRDTAEFPAEQQPGAARTAGLRRLSRLTWRATELSAVTAVGLATLFARTAPALGTFATLLVTDPDALIPAHDVLAAELAADRAAAAIEAATSCGVLVNLGGDLRVAGNPPAGGWRVGIADDADFDASTASVRPRQVVMIGDGGLATSSTLGRAWRRGGAELHHIVDPATGRPARTCWRTVSVAAASCAGAKHRGHGRDPARRAGD